MRTDIATEKAREREREREIWNLFATLYNRIDTVERGGGGVSVITGYPLLSSAPL